MATFRTDRRVVDDVREEKQIKKILPFTVTPITDLKAWKAEQAEKQAKWDAGREQRYATARERAIAVLNSQRAPSVDPNQEAFSSRVYGNMQVKLVPAKPTINTPAPKPSLLQRFGRWCLDLFLNINLN